MEHTQQTPIPLLFQQNSMHQQCHKGTGGSSLVRGSRLAADACCFANTNNGVISLIRYFVVLFLVPQHNKQHPGGIPLKQHERSEYHCILTGA